MDEIVPAFTAMHENGGRLPTECIFAFAHQFSSDVYTGLYNVAEYTVWRSGQDQTPIYDWHKRHLQTLQWVTERPTTRWVVKAPSHLSALPLVFSTYPDARVVITHRDPLRVIGSLSDLMATLHFMHSEHVDHGVLVEFMAMGLEMQMDHVTAERDAGDIPAEQIADVVYRDLVADPLGTVERLYAGWGLPLTPEFRCGARGLPGRPPHRPRRWPRLLLRRHRPRPGHPPGPGGALPGALRGPVRGLSGECSERRAVLRGAALKGETHGLETRDPGRPGVRRRPGQGLLRRRRRLPCRRGPPGRRGLPGRPADARAVRAAPSRS